VDLQRGILDQAPGTPGQGHVSKLDHTGFAGRSGGRAF
jgi:hypothetical protein